MGYRDNLEEKEELRAFRRQTRWFFGIFFVMSSVIVILLLSNLTGSSMQWSQYWLRVPFFQGTFGVDVALLLILMGYWYWIRGTRFTWLRDKVLSYVPIFGKTISKGGKEKELNDFFYPEVSFSDGIKRGKGFFYFQDQKANISVDTLFDFGKYSHSSDLTGTERIKALFRDKEQEFLIKEARNGRKKLSERAKKSLKSIREKYGRKPTEKQTLLYHDLFLMFEGIYKSYANDFGDKIFIGKHLKCPIKLYAIKNENGSSRISKIDVDKNIDVFTDGKVYFSISMIQSTVVNLTKLYIIFLEKRLGRGRFSTIQKTQLERFELFFKFFMFRRLLLNYSNIPSGWVCVKIEDYSMRAIASNIDREMIIDINEKNNGSTPVYNSDVEASEFLFTYWAFMYERRIRTMMEHLDFIFNASKEVKEINARKVALQAMQDIEKEHNETWNAISDDDLVYLSPKDSKE